MGEGGGGAQQGANKLETGKRESVRKKY